jgi:hypothetical protein
VLLAAPAPPGPRLTATGVPSARHDATHGRRVIERLERQQKWTIERSNATSCCVLDVISTPTCGNEDQHTPLRE